MTKRIHDRAVQHSLDRLWSSRCVPVIHHGTVLNSSGRQCLPVHRDEIFDEEFDPNSCKADRRRASRAVLGRLVS